MISLLSPRIRCLSNAKGRSFFPNAIFLRITLIKMDLSQNETNHISSQGEMLNFTKLSLHGKHQSSESTCKGVSCCLTIDLQHLIADSLSVILQFLQKGKTIGKVVYDVTRYLSLLFSKRAR